jgi:hypothetical protein
MDSLLLENQVCRIVNIPEGRLAQILGMKVTYNHITDSPTRLFKKTRGATITFYEADSDGITLALSNGDFLKIQASSGEFYIKNPQKEYGRFAETAVWVETGMHTSPRMLCTNDGILAKG